MCQMIWASYGVGVPDIRKLGIGLASFHWVKYSVWLGAIGSLCVLLSPGCTAQEDPDSRVVLSGPAAEELMRPCSRPAVENVETLWVPSPAHIQRVDDAVPGPGTRIRRCPR
jgi:hypothetical protein